MKLWTNLLAAVVVAGITSSAVADDDASLTTFNRDVAPIVFASCVSCHRPGEIGPFSMMDYKSLRPFAKSIKKSVVEKTMPPWHADSSKIAYANDPSLSKAQIDLIANWVDQGAPEGNPADLPKAPVFSSGWAMGTPDLIFHAKTDFLIKAGETKIEYQPVVFDFTPVGDEDLYITGWELRPTVAATCHHANMGIGPKPFEGVPSGNIVPHAVLGGGDYIGSYLPGARPMMYPQGMAYRIPKGSHAAIQVHYVGLDKDVTDHLMFGVKFAQGRIDKLVRIVGLFGVDGGLDIPPNDPDYVLIGNAVLLHDTLVMSSGVHMHLRGKSLLMEGIANDGTKELVTSIPKYDFNWQSTYWLKEPIRMAKGTTLRSEAHYDNSAANPHNPDPNARVKNGPWTEDEMLNTWAHSVVADEKLGYDVKDGRIVGKFPDAQTAPHPRFMQKVELTKMEVNKDAKFFNQEGLKIDPAAAKAAEEGK